jgi:hypothetical protein
MQPSFKNFHALLELPQLFARVAKLFGLRGHKMTKLLHLGARRLRCRDGTGIVRQSRLRGPVFLRGIRVRTIVICPSASCRNDSQASQNNKCGQKAHVFPVRDVALLRIARM